MSRFVLCSIKVWLFALGLLAAQCISQLLIAEELSDDSAVRQPISYRQIFVPAGKPDNWPTGGERLLPIESKELDRLLQQYSGLIQSDGTGIHARVSVKLDAAIDDPDTLTGQGEIEIFLETGQSKFIPWEVSSTSITNLRWQTSEEANSTSSDVLFGSWPSSAETSKGSQPLLRHGLLALSSGTLLFDFKAVANGSEFSLEMPEAISCQLHLTAPADLRPMSSKAIVNSTKQVLKDRSKNSASSTELAVKHWAIKAQTGAPLEFRLMESTASGENRAELGGTKNSAQQNKALNLIVSTDSHIELGSGGMQLSTQLHVSSNEYLPESLVLAVPPGSAIMAVTEDDDPIEWQLLPRTSGEINSGYVEVFLRNTTSRRSTITVRTWREDIQVGQGGLDVHDLSTEQFLDSPRTIDWITLPGASWTHGSASITVNDDIELVDVLKCDGAYWLESSDNGKQDLEPAEFALQLLRPAPKITLVTQESVIDPPQALQQDCKLTGAEARCSSTVILPSSLLRTGSTDHQAVPLEPTYFDIHTPWIVDSVESEPPDILDSWFLKTSKSGQRLAVTFKPSNPQLAASSSENSLGDDSDSPKTATPVAKLVISSRRQIVGNKTTVPLSQLVAVKDKQRPFTTSLLTITTAEPNALSLNPTALSQPSIEPLELESQIEIDLASRTGRKLYKTAAVQVIPRHLKLESTVRVSVEPMADALQYQATIAVDSEQNPTNAVLCYFDHPLPDQARWINPQTGEPLDAAKAPWLAAGVAVGALGELWSVRSPSVSEYPLQVQVLAQLPRQASLDIPLVMCPNARTQDGLVTLRGVESEDWWTSRVGMRATTPVNQGSVAFHYAPAQLTDSQQPVSLKLQLLDDAANRSHFARGAELLSLNSAWISKGDTIHTARYKLAVGARNFSFELPPYAKLLSVSDEQGQTISPIRRGEHHEVTLPLREAGGDLSRAAVSEFPESTLSPRVVLDVAYSSSSTNSSCLLPPLLPRTDARSFQWTWTVLAPEPWTVISLSGSGDLNESSGSDSIASWRQRLFGPIARQGHWPFNPFSIEDWVHPIRSAATQPQLSVQEAVRSMTSSGPRAGRPDRQLAGWRTYQFSGAASLPPPVKLVNRQTQQSWSLALQAVVMVAVAAWLLHRQGGNGNTWLGFVVGISAVTALLVPEGWVPWASAVWFGIVTAVPFGWMLSFIHSTTSRREQQSQQKVSRGLGKASIPLTTADSTGVLLLLIGLLIPACNSAAAEVTLKTNDPQNMHSVLIPIDKEGKLAGDKRYVAEPMLKQLIEADQIAGRTQPADIIITEVNYDGTVTSQSSNSTKVSVSRWRMTLRVNALKGGASVFLPLEKEQAEWGEWVSVDGVPTPLVWNDNGCRFVVAEPGPANAILNFKPIISTSQDVSAIDFAIPKFPGATLSLQLPESLADIQVESAISKPAVESGKLTTTLAAEGVLRVAWRDPNSAATRDQPSVDLLQWVYVESNQEESYAQEAEPRGPVTMQLRLSASTVPDSPIVVRVPAGWISARSPATTEIAFELLPKQDADNEGTTEPIFSATHLFVANRSTAIGQLQVPKTVLKGATIRRRVAAISVASDLKLTPRLDEGSRSISGEDFLTQWKRTSINSTRHGEGQPASSTPQPDSDLVQQDESPLPVVSAAASLSSSMAWTIGLTPNMEADDLASQTLSVTADMHKFYYQWKGGQQRDKSPVLALSVPPDLRVETVNLSAASSTAEEQELVRWKRVARDRLVIVRPPGLDARAVLTLTGSLAVSQESPDDPVEVPLIAVADQPNAPIQVSVLGTESVNVRSDWRPGEYAGELAAANNTPQDWQARQVAIYESSLKRPPRTIYLSPNKPLYTVTHLTSYDSRNGTIHSDWTAKVNVSSGRLGILPLKIASSALRGDRDLKLVSPAGARLIESDQVVGRNSVIHFAKPLRAGESTLVLLKSTMPSEESLISVQSPVTKRFSPPLAKSLGSFKSEAFVAIPSRNRKENADRLRWGYRGFAKIKLQTINQWLPADKEWRLYRIRKPDAQVTVRSSSLPVKAPNVRLVEYRLRAQPYVESSLKCDFWLQPRGSTSCWLELPSVSSVAQVTINGHQALCRPRIVKGRSSSKVYEIDLMSSSLSQRLEVTVLGKKSNSSQQAPVMITPAGEPIRPKQTLWFVKHLPNQTIQNVIDRKDLNNRELSALRLRALTGLLPKNRDDAEFAWNEAWRDYLQEVATAVYASGAIKSLAAVKDLPVDEQVDLATSSLLSVMNLCEQWLDDDAFQPAIANELGQESAIPIGWSAFTAEGSNSTTLPQLVPTATGDLLKRIVLALLLGVFFLAITWHLRHLDIERWAYENRYPLAGIGGLTWWLLLEPSIVGLVVLLAAAIGQLRYLIHQTNIQALSAE